MPTTDLYYNSATNSSTNPSNNSSSSRQVQSAVPASPGRTSSDRGTSPPPSPFQAGSELIQLASRQRNQEFHLLFRSVPEDDPLIDDFSCALQKDILIQGRLYVTRQHICFNSNIFGWVTNLVIAMTDILAIERRSTAYVIPNAVHFTTLHAKYMFTSFMSRELAYTTMVRLWRHAMGEEVDGLPFGSREGSPDRSNSGTTVGQRTLRNEGGTNSSGLFTSDTGSGTSMMGGRDRSPSPVRSIQTVGSVADSVPVAGGKVDVFSDDVLLPSDSKKLERQQLRGTSRSPESQSQRSDSNGSSNSNSPFASAKRRLSIPGIRNRSSNYKKPPEEPRSRSVSPSHLRTTLIPEENSSENTNENTMMESNGIQRLVDRSGYEEDDEGESDLMDGDAPNQRRRRMHTADSHQEAPASVFQSVKRRISFGATTQIPVEAATHVKFQTVDRPSTADTVLARTKTAPAVPSASQSGPLPDAPPGELMSGGGDGTPAIHLTAATMPRPTTTNIVSIPKQIPKPPFYCNCNDHGKQIVLDRVISMPLKEMHLKMFGDPEAKLLKCLLTTIRGFTDVDIGSWKNDDTRTINYVVPLKVAFGPKQTRCITQQKYTKKDMENCICIRETHNTPDVPSGSSFRTVVSQCLMRVSDTDSRILVGYDVEFMKSTWLKSAIERGAVDGNTTYWSDYEKLLIKESQGVKVEQTAVEGSAKPEDKVVVPKIEAASDTASFSPASFILSFYTRFGPLISAVLILLVLVNVYFLIRLHHMNTELDKILSATSADDLAAGRAPHSLPRWWFEGYDSQDFSNDYTDGSLELLLKRYHERVTEPAVIRFLREQSQQATDTFTNLVETFRNHLLEPTDVVYENETQ